jgi:hypothetical protein
VQLLGSAKVAFVVGLGGKIRTLDSILVSVVELESTTHGPKPRVSPSTPHRVYFLIYRMPTQVPAPAPNTLAIKVQWFSV